MGMASNLKSDGAGAGAGAGRVAGASFLKLVVGWRLGFPLWRSCVFISNVVPSGCVSLGCKCDDAVAAAGMGLGLGVGPGSSTMALAFPGPSVFPGMM